MSATPAPEPISRDRCLVATVGRQDCRCGTCCRELAEGVGTPEQFESVADARRQKLRQCLTQFTAHWGEPISDERN